MAEDLIGKTLGPYRIEGVLGRGGMGVVYAAHDEGLDRRAAVKVIHEELAQDEELVARFRREAKLAAKVTHPNLVAVYMTGSDEGVLYLGMEYVEGRTVSEVVRSRGQVPFREALGIVRAAAEGLAQIHRAGLVHRDIKAANIMVDTTGRARIMDFGLAKSFEAMSQLTQGQAFLGTPMTMAPEQWQHQDVAPATNVYALGVTLFEILTGRPPFRADDMAGMIHKILKEGAPSARTVHPGIPEEVSALVATMTARPMADRYADGSEVVAAIDACLDETADLEEAQEDVPTIVMPEPGAEPDTRPTLPSSVPPSRRITRLNTVFAVLLLVAAVFPHGLSDTKYLAMRWHERTTEILLIELETWPPEDAAEIGNLIETLSENGARVIGLDFVIDADTSLSNPKTLLAPIREAENVVLAVEIKGDVVGVLVEGLGDAVAGTGFANMVTDWDGRVRRARLVSVDADGVRMKSLALTLAEAFEAAQPAAGTEVQGTPSPADRTGGGFRGDLAIDFGAIEANMVVPSGSLKTAGEGWGKGFGRGKLVLIGTRSAEDEHRTPLWGDRGHVSGLELQGCIIDNLLNERWFVRAPSWVTALMLGAFLIVSALCGAFFGARWLSPVWVGLSAGVLVTAALALRFGAMSLPVMPVIVVVVVSSVVAARRGRRWLGFLRAS